MEREQAPPPWLVGGPAHSLTWNQQQQLPTGKGGSWLADWPDCPGLLRQPSKPVLPFLPVAAGYMTGWKISDRIMFPLNTQFYSY